MRHHRIQKIFLYILVMLFLSFWGIHLYAQSQPPSSDSAPADSLYFDPQVTIPGLEHPGGKGIPVADIEGGYIIATLLPRYIAVVFKFMVGIAITLAIVMIMVGGFLWTIAGGSQERVTNAKSYISHALTGLVIALLSYGILQGVNPQVLKLDAFKIRTVSKIDLTAGEKLHYCKDKDGDLHTFTGVSGVRCSDVNPEWITDVTVNSCLCVLIIDSRDPDNVVYESEFICYTNATPEFCHEQDDRLENSFYSKQSTDWACFPKEVDKCGDALEDVKLKMKILPAS